MRILVLGGDGMLGHQLLLSLQKHHTVCVSLRQSAEAYRDYPLFNQNNSYFNIDVRDDQPLLNILKDCKPEAVINAVGVIKQRQQAMDAMINIEINALFPHRLAKLCKITAVRMVHFSTDCVFSGRQGQYTEADLSDAKDFYGKSKYLGEVQERHCITLRTSVIGLELARKASLIEWFLSQTGNLTGFRRAIYSGLTTIEMARVVERLLINYPTLSGVWHVASQTPINKYDLLVELSHFLNRQDIQIKPDDSFVCDRSLIGDAFSQQTGYISPSWPVMLKELAEAVEAREANNNRPTQTINHPHIAQVVQ